MTATTTATAPCVTIDGTRQQQDFPDFTTAADFAGLLVLGVRNRQGDKRRKDGKGHCATSWNALTYVAYDIAGSDRPRIAIVGGVNYGVHTTAPADDYRAELAGRERLTLTTDELRQGDIVCEFGMFVLIDEAITTHQGHNGETVYHADGRVLNIAQVRGQGLVPRAYLRQEEFIVGKGWVCSDGDRWTIQGNTIPTWTVYRAA